VAAVAQERDDDGHLPLHVALEARASLAVLSYLLALYPDAAMTKDKWERLPLHLVCNGTPVEFVIELLAIFSQGARERKSGGQVPLYRAIVNKASIDALLVLLLADLPFFFDEQDGIFKPRDQDGSWMIIMDHPNATVEQVVFLIKHVLEKWPGLAEQLAHLMDSKGREAISICIPEGRALMNAYLLFLGRYDLQSWPPIHKSATAIVRWQAAYLLLT
jgi:hypothetical protein